MTNHSVEQSLAINIVEKNVVVSASAGAGKTTVLIDRLMKRIQKDRVSLDKIIAMTFTENAASEMKRRLSVKLNLAYGESNDPFLYEQITKLPGAQITTIHSFCLNIISNYSFVLGLDPQRARNVLDEGQIAYYMKLALESVMEKAYKDPPNGFFEFLDYFSSRPESDVDAKSAIKSVALMLHAKSDPEEWLKRSIDAYDTEGSLDNLNPDIKAYYYGRLRNNVDDLLVFFSEMETTFTHGGKKEVEFMQDFAATRIILDGLSKDFTGDGYTSIRDLYIKLGARIPKTNRGDSAYGSARTKFIDAYREIITDMYPEERFVTDLKNLHVIMQCLGKLTLQYRNEYARIKKEMNCIDYSDMEQFALEILRDDKFDVAKLFRSQYEEILVDEFQDSNDVQNDIVNLISSGDNVFRVGDIKQSIYRFRNAKPKLMQRLIDEQDPTKDEIIYLKNNYRSSKTIVDFNNLIFSNIMNIPGMKSTYSANDSVTIGCERQAGGSPVEFHWVETDETVLNPESVEEQEGFTKESDDGIQSETENEESDQDDFGDDGIVILNEKVVESQLKAQHIAADILARKAADPKIRWRDFVVLVRSHSYKAFLKKAFEEVNIPSYIDAKSGFFNASSVQDMLLMMNFCLHPGENLNLIGVLLSPFFKFSQDQVALVHLSKKEGESFHDSFVKSYPDTERLLNDVRDKSSTMQLRDFVPYLMNFNRYYELSCTHQQRTNLDLFLEKALLFDAQNGSLARFVDFVEEVKTAQSSEATPISDDMDVVRVMTIHQSKGLQFPIVYFWSIRIQNIRDTGKSMIADADLGIALRSVIYPDRYILNNPIRIAMKTKIAQEEKEEDMRILYVALTRAQNKLIIVDIADAQPVQPLSRSTVISSLGFSRWLKSVVQEDQTPLFTQSYVSGKKSSIIVPSEEDASVSYNPPHKVDRDITVLTPSSQESSFTPDFTLRYKNLFDGKERGTRLHRLIERLPIQDWSPELISSLDAACTDKEIDSLMRFYTSNFYQSAKQAVIEKEYPFAILDDSTAITGVIDMLAIYPDRIEMVDFKTDRSGNADELRLRYEGQIRLYRKSISLAFPAKQIKTYLYSFTLKEIIEVVPT